MCACEATFVCAACRRRWPLDVDPFYTDPAELEQERRDRLISAPDFHQPVGAA